MKMMMMRWWGDVALSLTLTQRGRGTLTISHTTGLKHWHIQILLHTGEDTPIHTFRYTKWRTHSPTHSPAHSPMHSPTHSSTHLPIHSPTWRNMEEWWNTHTHLPVHMLSRWHTLDTKPYLCARIVRFTEPKCYNLKVQWEVRSHSPPIRRTLLKLEIAILRQKSRVSWWHDRIALQSTRHTHSCPKHLGLWASEYMSKGMSMSLWVNVHIGRHTRSPTHWYPHWVDVHSVTL